ncbi:MAG: hypothetical protein COA45_12570 [Zetaproteobacteria bacterium]|nr:MAG: hypothetical protein COA45_12570 [Zetaproteobacteria bacterium]
MSDVTDFNDRVDALKQSLVDGQEEDAEGRFKVSSENLEQCILKIFKEYNNILINHPEELFQDKKHQNNCFLFKNLDTEFNFETAFKDIMKQCVAGNNSWLNVTRKIPCIQFENCAFGSFILGRYGVKDHTFSYIKLSKCLVRRASFDSYFFHYKYSLSFTAVETVFENLTFQSSGDAVPFNQCILFSKCNFDYTLKFQGVSTFKESVTFNECNIGSKDNRISLSGISFNNATFDNTTEFVDCNFYVSPKFHNTKLHSDTSFYLSRFLDCKSINAMGDYRALKVLMHNLGADQDATMFHALEMDARRNSVLTKTLHREGLARIASIFLKQFNDYGRNFWTPFVCLAGFCSLFFIIYLCSNALACNTSHFSSAEIWERTLCFNSSSEEIKDKVLASFVYSIQKSFGPLGLIFDSGLISAKYGWIKFIATIQVIFSSIIWYLIIVQFRRQFKL